MTLDGLTAGEVLESRRKFGANELTPPRQISLWERWLGKFRDPTIFILCICACMATIFSMVIGEMPWDGVAILIAVAIGTLGGALSEFKADKAFELLRRDGNRTMVKVRRGGVFHTIPSTEVVVGDIVLLENGDRVPADGFIVESLNACFDESLMTGESEVVHRSAGSRILGGVRGGTYLVSGSATIRVEAVGDHSELGEIARSLAEEDKEPQTPLQRRLAGLAKDISIWGIVGAALIFLALVVPVLLTPASWTTLAFEVLKAFMMAVTVVVVAVPEGLPLAVVIALGLGMRRIREDNNLVRKMVAAETIGSVTVVCTDKTGTLTKNRMSVTQIVHFPGLDEIASRRYLQLGCAVNSTAEIEHRDGGEFFVGNPTECAMLVKLREQGVDYRRLRNEHPMIGRIPFSAERKMMSTLIRDGERELLLVKGAPERVFPKCASVPTEAYETVGKMAGEAIRAIAIAYKIVDSLKRLSESDEGDLVLLGVIGFADPIREDVPEAIGQCVSAGIDVKMITGDHPLTAQAIANKIGMLKDGDVVLTDEQFSSVSDGEMLKVLPRLRILARAKPNSKMRLVELLQRMGHVVAMTGDGTNDAPALRRADVGISMGLRGTDVAKQASDIVLTDDNFGSIVKAVHWGRTLYENLQKFVQFQLSVNLSALGMAFFSPILAMLFPDAGFLTQPLTVLQYLWINLIMDTFAAIAFGLEPPRDETLRMPPKKTEEPFLTRIILTNIAVFGGYFACLILAVEAFDILGIDHYADLMDSERFRLLKTSVVFNCYVWFQIFHMINARSIQRGASAFENILKSHVFLTIVGLVAAVQFVFVHFGNMLLVSEALPLDVWFKIILLGSSAVVVGEILRAFQRLGTPRQYP